MQCLRRIEEKRDSTAWELGHCLTPVCLTTYVVQVALAAGVLLSLFAIAMIAAFGVKPPLDDSVLSAAGAVFLTVAVIGYNRKRSREVERMPDC
jgi:hypothetical protein